VTVHNEGPPIPAELLPVLYEPFTRGARATASRRGLGLGLFIVKQIVVAHGGTIGVESAADIGTTFTVRLPRANKR
jgi:signal transduction histidine kinase